MEQIKQRFTCPVAKGCGGCQLQHLSYEDQLRRKELQVRQLLRPFGKVSPIWGMENPLHYRNKNHLVVGCGRHGAPILGMYQAKSHRVVPVLDCMLQDERANGVFHTIQELAYSFHLKAYQEDLGQGLLRHVLIRTGFFSGEMMVVLVTGTPVFPNRQNFVRALVQRHPQITTVVQSIHRRRNSMILGDQEQVLYGRGYITDTLCGKTFRISASSFYQINPLQTQRLYGQAVAFAGLTGRETVVDAYCGIGTIGLVASDGAKRVLCVEQNPAAVRDAKSNCRDNGADQVQVICGDATEYMLRLAQRREQVDVVFLDPPRSGTTQEFVEAVSRLAPSRVVYVSCNPETLARDLAWFARKGYGLRQAQPVDMFPYTEHVETVVLLSKGAINTKSGS